MNDQNQIPPQAELVFEGVRSKVYQWQQKMYDGSVDTFERIRFIDGAFVVGVIDDRIIITHQEQPARTPFIGLPGGAFDFPEEDPLLCAQREFLEETGYKSDTWEHWLTTEGTNNLISYTHFYIARSAYKVGDITPDPGERIRLELIDFDQFLTLSDHPQFTNWSIQQVLFMARLYPEKYMALKTKIIGSGS